MNRQIGFVQLVRRTIETSPQRCYPDLEKVRKKVKKNLCCFLLPGWLYNGIFYYISLKLNHLMQLFGESASAKIETFAESPSRHSLPVTVVFNHDHAPCDQTNLQNTGPSLEWPVEFLNFDINLILWWKYKVFYVNGLGKIQAFIFCRDHPALKTLQKIFMIFTSCIHLKLEILQWHFHARTSLKSLRLRKLLE